MNIYRRNYKWPKNRGRIVCNGDVVKGFEIVESGTETGVTIEAKDLSHVWTVVLSPQETDLLIKSLLKKRPETQ